MLHLDQIRRTLSAYRPVSRAADDGDTLAAVAIILTGNVEDPSLLFIERAERSGDPWSGQMAFPGGRHDPGDSSLCMTAVRETREEVGLDISSSEVLGRLDEQGGRRVGAPSGIRVAPFVFFEESPGALVLNHEVQSAMWVPLSRLLDPARRVEYHHRGIGGPFEGVLVGEPDRHVVWGLTRRMLRSFVELFGLSLP